MSELGAGHAAMTPCPEQLYSNAASGAHSGWFLSSL